MGFLSGVLEAVKNENEVTTYDKNEIKLQNVLNTLQSQIGSGRNGLVDAVGEVKAWLEGYYTFLTNNTNHVIESLRSIQKVNFNHISNSLIALNDCSPSDVANKIGDCIDKANKLPAAFKEASNEVHSRLDPQLRKQLQNTVRNVEVAIEKFVAGATNEPLKAVAEMAQWQLGTLQGQLNKHVAERITTLHGALQTTFDKSIQQPINIVKQKLDQINTELTKWISAAGKVIGNAIEKCDEIIKMVDVEHPDNASTGGPELYKQAKDLHSKAIKLRQAADSAVSAVKRSVKNALANVIVMDRAVKMGLKRTKDGIEEKMWIYVKDQLLKDVKENVEKITGTEGNYGIADIVEAVQQWSESFKRQDGLDDILDKWILGILNKEPVKTHLNKYIRAKNDHFQEEYRVGSDGDNTELCKKIATEIRKKIPNEILTQTVLTVNSVNPDGTVRGYVQAVMMGCETFASKLGEKLRGERDKIDAGKIFKEIDTVLTGQDSSNANDLHRAVSILFYQLVVAARQTGEGLWEFVTDDSNMSSNIRAALDIAQPFEKNLQTATKRRQPHDPPVEAITIDGGGSTTYKVDGIIRGVVEKELGKDAEGNNSGQVVNVHADYFMDYESQLKQASLNGATADNPEPLEGKLPQSIKNISNVSLQTLTTTEIEAMLKPHNQVFNKPFEDIARELTEIANLVKVTNGDIQQKGVKTHLQDIEKMLCNDKAGGLYDLNSGLSKIQRDVKAIIGERADETAPNTLNTIIQKAEQFYYQIQIDSQTCIDDLKGDIQKEATAAREAIQNTAKVLYYKNVGKSFEEMERRVGRNITTITTIINNDLKSGVKGLLKTMNASGDKLVTLIDKRSVEEFSPIWSKVSDAILQYVKWQVDPLGEPQATVEAQRQHPPPISGGGYLARPATPTAPKSNTNQKARTSSSSDKQSNQVSAIHLTLERLFYFMQQFGHFNVTFQNNLANVKDALSRFIPMKFSGDLNPLLLDVLKCGVESFVTELNKAYVSAYSGRVISWDDSAEGRNVAKAFLTLLNIVVEDLTTLKDKCEKSYTYGWKHKKICKTQEGKGNSLGTFFESCGYKIPSDDKGKQDAELQCMDNMKGSDIREKLVGYNVTNVFRTEGKGPLEILFEDIERYNEVCHLSTLDSRKNPCSVYDMLIWLSGLPYNVARSSLLREGIGSLLENPHKALADKADGLDLSVFSMGDFYLDAHPSKITYHDIDNTIHHISSNAYDIITCISGTGDEATFYGSDLCNNSFKFKYPNSGEECLDMLLDILRRLFPPLKFLLSQCSYPATLHGWSQCEYGRDVSTTKWPCKKHSRSESACQANCQPTCRPNDQPNCEPKSPLMSYLNDCLPGHIPHQLTDIGCKYKCETCPKSTPGQPCLTPLGFRGFSGSTKTGKDICRVLNRFFDDRNLSALFGLSTKTPTTLPEHFGFVSCLVKGWVQKSSMVGENIQKAFHKSISSRSIALYKEPSELTDALRNAYGDARPAHVDKSHLAAYAALSHLSITTCSDPNQKAYCAPYITSLCRDAYTCLPFKNSNTYLSWAVYLPWDFWQLLNNFYNDFCDILCQDWGCRTCLRADKCRRGKHGLVEKLDNKADSPHCKCPSMVQCRGVSPTLYRYGFVFGEGSTLNDGNSKKLCSDFCTQLNDVLNSQYFKNLFTKCDEYLLAIRLPFMSLTLALWLLSLLYLIHIMVIRLDLLHIKSHLHSPSSHRIAAQSLLAAARVNKLGRVFYLQP